MKLEKFDKNKNRKIIVVSVVLGLFLILGGVYLFRSHAIFEEYKTFDVIFGKVPPFKKKEKDLELAILVNGESVSEAPTDGDYRVRVECDTEEISGEWNYSTKKAHISGDVSKPAVCTIIFESIYNSITVDGESRNTFPEKGDYQYNMTCSNVTDYSWNEDTWIPTVTGVNKDSSCDVVFKSTNNIITKITLDGEPIESYPDKDENLKTTITCTPESVTGEWDKENWKVKKVSNITNETTCEVAFETIPPFYNNVSIGDYVAYTPSSTSYEISAESTGYSSKQTINPSELNSWRVIKKNDDGTIEIVSEYTSSNVVYFEGGEGYRRFVGTLNEIASAYEIEGITSSSRHVGGTGEQATCSSYDTCSDQKTNSSEDTPDTKLIKAAIGRLLAYKPNGTDVSSYWVASRFHDDKYRARFVYMGSGLSASWLKYSHGGSMAKYGVRPIVILKSGLTATELEDKTDTNQNKTFKQWKVN